MLSVKISGSYRHGSEQIDFSDFEVVMPECPESWIYSNIQNRCFKPQWFEKNKDNPDYKSPDYLIAVYIDSIDRASKASVKPSCCGKSLKNLNWGELQDLAMVYCLREIPLYKVGDLKSAQRKAYELYVTKIMDQQVDSPFNIEDAIDIKVPDRPGKINKITGNDKAILEGTDMINGKPNQSNGFNQQSGF